MDKFYSIVVIVAFVVLVIALIGLGVMLQKQDSKTVFPPVQNQCPDGWTPDKTDGSSLATGEHDVCTMSDTAADQKNVGTFDPGAVTAFDVKYLIKADGVSSYTASTTNSQTTLDKISNKYVVRFNSAALPCDKKKWANAHGIIWDGISNYNQC
jgi:hypothetical protein